MNKKLKALSNHLKAQRQPEVVVIRTIEDLAAHEVLVVYHHDNSYTFPGERQGRILNVRWIEKHPTNQGLNVYIKEDMLNTGTWHHYTSVLRFVDSYVRIEE